MSAHHARKVLPKARIVDVTHASLLVGALYSCADVCRLAAALTIAVIVEVIALIASRFEREFVKPWADVTCVVVREMPDESWPFKRHPNAGLLNSQARSFSTPYFSSSLLSVASYTSRSLFFPPMSGIGGWPLTDSHSRSIGNWCEVASVGHLAPVDGHSMHGLAGGDTWLMMVAAELRIRLADRINHLVLPESMKQTALAIQDSFNLDANTELMRQFPEILGDRAVEMHTAVIVVDDRATYLAKRGNYEFFALTH